MFNIAMALLAGFNTFMATKALQEFLQAESWRNGIGCVLSISLVFWILFKAIRTEK